MSPRRCLTVLAGDVMEAGADRSAQLPPAKSGLAGRGGGGGGEECAFIRARSCLLFFSLARRPDRIALPTVHRQLAGLEPRLFLLAVLVSADWHLASRPRRTKPTRLHFFVSRDFSRPRRAPVVCQICGVCLRVSVNCFKCCSKEQFLSVRFIL